MTRTEHLEYLKSKIENMDTLISCKLQNTNGIVQCVLSDLFYTYIDNTDLIYVIDKKGNPFYVTLENLTLI